MVGDKNFKFCLENQGGWWGGWHMRSPPTLPPPQNLKRAPGAEKNYYLMRATLHQVKQYYILLSVREAGYAASSKAILYTIISTRGSLSGNKVSLPAGKQPNLLFFKGLIPHSHQKLSCLKSSVSS